MHHKIFYHLLRYINCRPEEQNKKTLGKIYHCARVIKFYVPSVFLHSGLRCKKHETNVMRSHDSKMKQSLTTQV